MLDTIRAEAAKYPELELIVRDATDSIPQQLADMEYFISAGVDAILISPKVTEELTPPVSKAFSRRLSNLGLIYCAGGRAAPMAYGAYLAARDINRETNIVFLGIDGIPSEGVRWVDEGILDATFLYKTKDARFL